MLAALSCLALCGGDPTDGGVDDGGAGAGACAGAGGDADEARAVADVVRREGFAVVRSVIPTALVAAMAADAPGLLEVRMKGGPSDRGPGRYYITPPFQGVWSDARVVANPRLVAIVEALVGPDPVLCQVGIDVPVGGNSSQYQKIHRDTGSLFPGSRWDPPAPYQLAVNFALCDVTPGLDNGPVEMHRGGSHLWTVEQGAAEIARGNVVVEPVYLRKGDVIVRDVRGLHRGTPNRSPHPRPMVVIGYSSRWLRRPEVGIKVPQQVLDTANPTVRSLLRFESVVPEITPYDGREGYDATTLAQASGGSYKDGP